MNSSNNINTPITTFRTPNTTDDCSSKQLEQQHSSCKLGRIWKNITGDIVSYSKKITEFFSQRNEAPRGELTTRQVGKLDRKSKQEEKVRNFKEFLNNRIINNNIKDIKDIDDKTKNFFHNIGKLANLSLIDVNKLIAEILENKKQEMAGKVVVLEKALKESVTIDNLDGNTEEYIYEMGNLLANLNKDDVDGLIAQLKAEFGQTVDELYKMSRSLSLKKLEASGEGDARKGLDSYFERLKKNFDDPKTTFAEKRKIVDQLFSLIPDDSCSTETKSKFEEAKTLGEMQKIFNEVKRQKLEKREKLEKLFRSSIPLPPSIATNTESFLLDGGDPPNSSSVREGYTNHSPGVAGEVQGSRETYVGIQRKDNSVNTLLFLKGDAVNNINAESNRKIPPQKLLREAIEQAKSQLGGEDTSVKVKSSFDEKLQDDNPHFTVKEEFNSRGMKLYKVAVSYTIEVKNANGEVIKITLDRDFYSNAANGKEALLAIYGVVKGIEQQAKEDNPTNDALEQKLFTISYERNPQSRDILGINSITGDRDIQLPSSIARKTTVGGNEGDETGRGQALSEQALLLRSTIKFIDAPIVDRLRQGNFDAKQYISGQTNEANQLKAAFSRFKKEIVKDDLLKWIVKNKKDLDTQIDNILSGKAEPKNLTFSNKMKAYLQLKRKYNEFEDNSETIAKLEKIKQDLRSNQLVGKDEEKFVNALREKKMKIDFEISLTPDTVEHLLASIRFEQRAFKALETKYTKAREDALKEHKELFKNLSDMKYIQNELNDRKGELEKLLAAIQDGEAANDMIQSKTQITQALSEIGRQIDENAGVLKLEGYLSRLFDGKIDQMTDAYVFS